MSLRSLNAARRALVPLLLLGFIAGAAPAASGGGKSNTQVRLSYGFYVADIDGTDGSAELLQVADNRLFAYRSNIDTTGVLHHYFTAEVSKLVTGDFKGRGRDDICALLADGRFECYTIGSNGRELWWGFTQTGLIGSGEEAIVGDFDGNNTDDLLVYKPSTGAVRVYTRGNPHFVLMPGFSLGNLANFDRVNKEIYAGEFGQNYGRDDLLVVDRAAGWAARFDSATDASGTKTFWWAFTSASGAIRSNEQISVANTQSRGRDGLVLRNTATGAYRMLAVEYGNGYLSTVPVRTGQLPVTTHSARAFFAKLKTLSEPGGQERDDVLFFDYTSKALSRIEARYDPAAANFTYWSAYDRELPVNYSSAWPEIRKDRWVVIPCKFRKPSEIPSGLTIDMMQRLFTGAGAGQSGAYDYFREVSFGMIDLSTTQVLTTWTEIPHELKGFAADTSPIIDPPLTRDTLIETCVRRSGATVDRDRVVVAMNAVSTTGRTDSGVIMDPAVFGVGTAAHEMGHVYGLNDTFDDMGNGYGDMWDMMSSPAGGFCYETGPGIGADSCKKGNPDGSVGDVGVKVAGGPEFNAPHKYTLGYLPGARLTVLPPDLSKWQTRRVTVAALNRPESDGSLMVRIPYPGTPDPNAKYYTIEFRQAQGWDKAIPRDTVLIHRVEDGKVMLVTQPSREWLEGSFFQNGDIAVSVDDIVGASGNAKVTITY